MVSMLLPLRAGDHADKTVFNVPDDTSTSWTHGNTYQPFALMKGAFAELGKGMRSHNGEVSFDSSRRKQEMLETTCGLFSQVYAKASAQFVQDIRASNPSALLLLRHFDSTPCVFFAIRRRSRSLETEWTLFCAG